MGVSISNLPIIVTPTLSDIFPVVQSGVTYRESFTQLSSLFATSGANSNITSLTGLSTPLSIAQGGTASATGDPTFASLTFSPTTQGIVGTTTNDNAGAGYVGQVISNTAAAVALTSTVVANVTSVSLTAGDWDVFGSIRFVPAAGTTTASTETSISSTSATHDAFSTAGGARLATVASAYPAPTARISLASTTTIYLVATATFAVSTMAANGLLIGRRRR